MSLKFKDPTHNKTLIIITPIETSYETICAADLIAPKKGYFELDAHPPIIIPYTPSDETAKRYKIPTLMSARTKSSPIGEDFVLADINVGILYLFAVSSLGVYGIIMGGWASNSKYPFLGAIRSAAQMVSYEVSIGVIIINVLLCVGSLNLSDIVMAQQNLWFVIPLFPMFVIFFISALAETNRPPFDLPEAEAELVAGYQTEYSGMMYAMFWLGEYANILLMCAMGAVLFLGGWLSPIDIFPFNVIPGPFWLIFKILFLFILFALVKATVPRYRYDQLMKLGWKIFLPFSLFYVVLTSSFLLYFDLLPGK